MSNTIKVASIDFGEIKNNLIAHFKTQEKYKEWDFESPGSTLNMLCEVLAYNTANNAVIANRSASEKFLDSAQSRSSVLSRAKEMGYNPQSAKCSQMVVDVVIETSSGLDFMILPRGTRFSVSGVSTGATSFITDRDYIGYPDANNIIVFSEVTLFYGTLTTLYVATSGSRSYTIPDSTIDTDTLEITVNGYSAKRLFRDINLYDVKDDTLIYQVQENQFGTYDIIFGDGVLGTRIGSADTVYATYIKTASDLAAEGISKVQLSSSYSNVVASDVIVRTPSSGYKPKESVASIKLNAPLALKANNRCVTLADYKHMIDTRYPFVKSSVVWTTDLEEVDFYDYGAVYFSAVNEINEPLDSGQALIISQDIEENYGVAGISLVHVPMEIITISPYVRVEIDEWLTKMNQTEISGAVIAAIKEVADSTAGITKTFSAYTLSKAITASIAGISFVQVDLRLMKTAQLYASAQSDLSFSFGTELTHPFDGYGEMADGVLRSSGFRTEGQTNQMFFNDDGFGNIRLFYQTTEGAKKYVSGNIGKIDYSTGTVNISGISPRFEEFITVVGIPASNNLAVIKNNMLVLDHTKAIIDITIKPTRVR